MKHDILLAGAGQLGSRYLQGMAKYDAPLSIWVLDPSRDSLSRAGQRWDEVAGPDTIHAVRYVEQITDLPRTFSLAVLSTTADVRPELAVAISAHARIENWVCEKVLAQNSAGLRAIEGCVANRRAWVNTPMYMWPLYRRLRDRFDNQPVIAHFQGFRGLACNAIHYIDLVARWNDADIIRIDTSGLQAQWHPAKRDGFHEIEGRLDVDFSDGSRLTLTSGNGGEEYQVVLQCDGQKWHVSEAKGCAVSAAGQRIEGGTGFQSSLTAPMMAEIFEHGTCALPTLEQSIRQHEPYLQALLAHWHASGNSGNLLPIT